MSRPAFSLSDPEARQLAQLADALHKRHPHNPRDHRQYIRGLMRAVHTATGRVYSPAIYRRLLAVYAPDRRPSTATPGAGKSLAR